jgi:hypothetical protein
VPDGATVEPPADGAARAPEALVTVLLEIERYVGAEGWDQPPRLFALVSTARLIEAEPALAAELGLRGSTEGTPADALTAVEQDHFQPTEDIVADLAGLVWPPTVDGCAVALERTFLPAGSEVELPDDPAAAGAMVAAHPDRHDVRVVVGVDRSGNRHGVARLRSAPDELLGAADLVPGLTEVLAHTLA